MSLKKNELEDLFAMQSLGLPESVKKEILKPTGRGGVFAARDYVAANALLAECIKAGLDFSKVTYDTDLWDALHPATKFRLRMYTPCLAARYDELKPAEQQKLFNDKSWRFLEKINGCRCVLIVHKGKVFAYSRNYSDKDCGLLEYWSNIDQQVTWDEGVFAIDTEIKFEPGVDISEDLEHLGITTSSPLEAMVALLHTYPEEAVKIQQKFRAKYGTELVTFRLIAPLYFEGKNYLKRTLGEGKEVYDKCVEFGQSIGLNLKPIAMCNGTKEEKEIFLNTILNEGGEGIVAHYDKGSYCTSENRSKTSFIKLKRAVGSDNMAGMGDTIDAWVSGFKMGSNGTANEGIIGALEFSCFVNNNGKIFEHVIAMVPNITREQAILATVNDATGLYPQEVTMSDGSVKWFSLNPEFHHLVGELSGQSFSSKSRRLTHPRLLRWRLEKDWTSCTLTKEFIESQMDINLR